MEYFFILGRNPQLSLAEIFSYFEKYDIKVEKYFLDENNLLLKSNKEIDEKKAIKSLGGTIALAKVSVSSKKIDEIISWIENNEIYFGEEIKFTYSIIGEEDLRQEIYASIKEKFAAERLKARLRNPFGRIRMQNAEAKNTATPSKMNSKDINYFIFKSDKYYFGTFEKSYEIKEMEKRDMKKPERREELAIPPRLAKILINLSQVKENETLIDPFCGIGVIIQEALLQDINTIGIDIDIPAIDYAKKNLAWLKENYKITANSKIFRADSKFFKIYADEKVNGIACEPSLGKLLRTLPSEEEAVFITSKFEALIISVLNNLKHYLPKKSKIAFTSPYIKTRYGRIACNINTICRATNLKVHEISNIKFPIKEFRESQIVGREIHILEI